MRGIKAANPTRARDRQLRFQLDSGLLVTSVQKLDTVMHTIVFEEVASPLKLALFVTVLEAVRLTRLDAVLLKSCVGLKLALPSSDIDRDMDAYLEDDRVTVEEGLVITESLRVTLDVTLLVMVCGAVTVNVWVTLDVTPLVMVCGAVTVNVVDKSQKSCQCKYLSVTPESYVEHPDVGTHCEPVRPVSVQWIKNKRVFGLNPLKGIFGR
eukprot:gene25040-biopygen10373